jgi:uncharacterized protein (TIGR03435 family)
MKIACTLSVSRKLFVGTIRALVVCTPIVFGLASATPSKAQSRPQILAAPAPAATFQYEVASIKPSKPASGNSYMLMGMKYTDDGLTGENVPLMYLIQNAYGISRDRISGAPPWSISERYDIDAKMDEAAAKELKKLRPDELKVVRQQMLQALLAERFKLTVHREEKELAVYNLVVAKNGPKIQESKPEDSKASESAPAKSSSPNSQMMMSSGGGGGGGSANLPVGAVSVSFGAKGGLRHTSGKDATIESLLALLSSAAGRPVLDKTGLTGKYDYKLEWAPDNLQADAEPSGPSIFTAVQEQLGLKLESGKGPVEIIVIDHAEQASGN